MLRAKKSLGQNFLIDERVIEQIVSAVDPREGETILEIGPGHGALTSGLIERASRLIAIEYDRNLIPLLRDQFGHSESFTLIEADALEVDVCALVAPAKTARLVANLPYYISTAILQKLLKQRECLTEMVLMLQSEVVERIMAAPSSSERGFLSVLVQAYAEVEKLFDVAPDAFRPTPKVRSTVVRLHTRSQIAAPVKDETLFWQIVSAGFAQRRKTIFNNLRHAPSDLQRKIDEAGGAAHLLEVAGIDPCRRAETLSLEEWARLSF